MRAAVLSLQGVDQQGPHQQEVHIVHAQQEHPLVPEVEHACLPLLLPGELADCTRQFLQEQLHCWHAPRAVKAGV
jgi:hypothetical protein